MARSTTPFFGRSYLLTVKPVTQPGTVIVVSGDQFEPNALRFTFDISQVAYATGSARWYAQIEIFNCDGEITYGPSAGKKLVAEMLTEGSEVVVQAGYQADGEPIVIWDGIIYQALWERVDVVDFKLTLRCMLVRASETMASLVLDKLTTGMDQVKRIAAACQTPFQVEDAQAQMIKAPPLIRSKVVYGNADRYLSALATDSQLVSWFTKHKFNMAAVEDSGQKALTYAPATLLDRAPTKLPDGTTLSIVGCPQQTQLGMTFRVLLDSRLQIVSPLVVVSVDMRYIRQAAVQPSPNGEFPALPLPMAQRYFVLGVRHFGDTRGNQWYTDVTCVSQIMNAMALVGGGHG